MWHDVQISRDLDRGVLLASSTSRIYHSAISILIVSSSPFLPPFHRLFVLILILPSSRAYLERKVTPQNLLYWQWALSLCFFANYYPVHRRVIMSGVQVVAIRVASSHYIDDDLAKKFNLYFGSKFRHNCGLGQVKRLK